MAVAVAFSFPLGEYHATAWDRAVNSGDSEWPPSPWRILRALLSTWHTRCPDLATNSVERVIHLLSGEAPSYLLPPTTPSHTRHYLPGVDHSATVRDTTYTLAPRLQLEHEARVVVLWPGVELNTDDRHVLGTLLEMLPYLGRAESICEGSLVDPSELPASAEAWTVPADGGADDLRVLTPTADVTRAQLEASPDEMRRARRLVPDGARWQGYHGGVPPEPDRVERATTVPTTVRWAVGGAVPILEHSAVLATSGLRSSVLALIKSRGLESATGAWHLAGRHEGADVSDRHVHAHWLWLGARRGHSAPLSTGPGRGHEDAKVVEVALWVPAGIPAHLLTTVLAIGRLARPAHPPKGYVPAAVHLQAMGKVEQVLPELTGVSARWRTRTPMLTDRHPKRHRMPDAFIRGELERELGFRDWHGAARPRVTSLEVHNDWHAGSVKDYRRYRWNENMAQRRRGFDVTVELDRPIAGPVSLGALNHFGFGLFEPVRET